MRPLARFEVVEEQWAWHIHVRCRYGFHGPDGECERCKPLHDQTRDLGADRMFMNLFQMCVEKKHPGPISDWLGENGFPELAEIFFDLFLKAEEKEAARKELIDSRLYKEQPTPLPATPPATTGPQTESLP